MSRWDRAITVGKQVTKPKRKSLILVSTNDFREILTTLKEDGALRLVIYPPGAGVNLGVDVTTDGFAVDAMIEDWEESKKASRLI